MGIIWGHVRGCLPELVSKAPPVQESELLCLL